MSASNANTRVVLGGYEHHVVACAGDAQTTYIQGLRFNYAIYRERKYLAEVAGADTGWSEYRFIQILAGTSYIVVLSQHVYSG